MSENTTFLHFLSRGNFGVFRGISPRADLLLCAKTAQFFGGKLGSFWAKFGTPKFPKCALFAHLQKKVHFFRQKFPPGFFGFWQNFIIFMKFIIDYKAKLPQRPKKGGVKLVKKKKFRNSRKSEKKWREFSGGFFGVFCTFFDPPKITKINDYSPEHHFFEKTRKWRFRKFRKFRENFPPKFSPEKYFPQIFVKILFNFYKFIIDYSR